MTLTAQLEAYLKSRPNEWIDARELLPVAGFAAWRTRLSECRAERGMHIENRTFRARLEDGREVTRSLYRYTPAEEQVSA